MIALVLLLASACSGVSEQTRSQIQFMQELQKQTQAILSEYRTLEREADPEKDLFIPWNRDEELWAQVKRRMEELWSPCVQDPLENSRAFRWMFFWNYVVPEHAWEFSPAESQHDSWQILARLDLWKGDDVLEVGIRLEASGPSWRILDVQTAPGMQLRRDQGAEPFARDYVHHVMTSLRSVPEYSLLFDSSGEEGLRDVRQRTRSLLTPLGIARAEAAYERLEDWDPYWGEFIYLPWLPPPDLQVEVRSEMGEQNQRHTIVRVRLSPRDGGPAPFGDRRPRPITLDLVQQDGLWYLAALPRWHTLEKVFEFHRDAQNGNWNYQNIGAHH